MLDRSKIVDLLNDYKLDKSKFIVISGAAMVLYGIKDYTNDIDIAVTKDYYNYLLSNYNCEIERINEFGNRVFLIDKIINFSTNYYSNYNIVDNIRVQTIDDLIKLKKFLKRDKDYADLEKIKKYIE